MKPLLALVLLALLPGCTPPPPATTAQGQCEQQADADPAVHALVVQSTVDSLDPIWQNKLAKARRKAVSDCMAAKGFPQRGGVEAIRSGF